MWTRCTALPIVALLLSCADPPLAPESTAEPLTPSFISFEALGAGDTLVAVHHASGCSYDVLSTLIIVPADHGARLSLADLRANLAPGWHLIAKPIITPAELAGLDRLLAAYRHGRAPEPCRAMVGLSLSLRRGGTEILRETYHDNTCLASADASIVTLGSFLELARR